VGDDGLPLPGCGWRPPSHQAPVVPDSAAAALPSPLDLMKGYDDVMFPGQAGRGRF